ncbi:MAG: hypothetical protein IKL52_05015, partial [Candidatus Gastranaerophilales bacterium]|nr:hypothetical protein [Candidatus Gastranaerophilales bacterium]
MKIAPVSNTLLQKHAKFKISTPISFGDIDGDSIVINGKAKEIPMMSPQWEFLKMNFSMLNHRCIPFYETGQKLMNDAYLMEHGALGMINKASLLSENSLEKFDEAMALVEEVEQRNFESYYSFDYASGWSKREVEKTPEGYVITEYDADDEAEAIRRVKIGRESVTFQDIRYVSGLIDEYVFDRNSKQLLALTLGKSEGLSGGYKAQEQYTFNYDGELFSYSKDYKTTKDADETIGQIYYFESNQIKNYYQNYFNGGEPFKTTADIALHFGENGCTRADLRYKETNDTEFASRQYLFDTHGYIDACINGLKSQKHGLTSASSVYLYKNGAPNQILTKYETYQATIYLYFISFTEINY